MVAMSPRTKAIATIAIADDLNRDSDDALVPVLGNDRGCAADGDPGPPGFGRVTTTGIGSSPTSTSPGANSTVLQASAIQQILSVPDEGGATHSGVTTRTNDDGLDESGPVVFATAHLMGRMCSGSRASTLMGVPATTGT